MVLKGNGKSADLGCSGHGDDQPKANTCLPNDCRQRLVAGIPTTKISFEPAETPNDKVSGTGIQLDADP